LKFNMDNDRQFLDVVEKNVSNPYVKERLRNRLEWYMISANRYQRLYELATCVGILVPTVILLMNSVPSEVLPDELRQLFITAFSGFSSVICGFSGNFSWHENMVQYRVSAEQIKKETSLYMEGVGMYSDRCRRDGIFLRVLEDLSVKENRQWQKREISHSGNNKNAKEDA